MQPFSMEVDCQLLFIKHGVISKTTTRALANTATVKSSNSFVYNNVVLPYGALTQSKQNKTKQNKNKQTNKNNKLVNKQQTNK